MKRHRSFALIFPGFGHKPLLVTAIISAFYCFPPKASAQQVKLDIPFQAGEEKERTRPAPPPQAIKSTKVIKGLITDTTGDPLIGATILVQLDSEKTGAMADADGKFTFKVPSSYTKDSVLVKILYVGFISQERRLSLSLKNDHLEFCLAIDQRQVGCPVIRSFKQQKITDLVNKPDLITIR